jgi:hypothetical protein
MSIIQKFVEEEGKPKMFLFWCPACNCGHLFTEGIWEWNENFDKPTISPSLLVKLVKVPKDIPKNEDGTYQVDQNGRIVGCTDEVCHSFVTDGRIQFLSDCTHSLSGQTVDLVDFDESVITK